MLFRSCALFSKDFTNTRLSFFCSYGIGPGETVQTIYHFRFHHEVQENQSTLVYQFKKFVCTMLTKRIIAYVFESSSMLLTHIIDQRVIVQYKRYISRIYFTLIKMRKNYKKFKEK